MKRNTLTQIIRHATSSLTLLALVGVGTASAQGFLDRLKPAATPTEGDQPQPPTMTNDALILSFVTSQAHLLSAQANFLEAFDLKDDASLLRTERDSLSSGAVDNSKLKKIESISEEAQKKIDAKMAEEREISANGRELYSAGLINFTAALMEGVKTVEAAKQFVGSAKSNPLALLSNEARSAAYVAKEAPGYFINLKKSAGMAISYGKRNKIEAPADATSMMDDM